MPSLYSMMAFLVGKPKACLKPWVIPCCLSIVCLWYLPELVHFVLSNIPASIYIWGLLWGVVLMLLLILLPFSVPISPSLETFPGTHGTHGARNTMCLVLPLPWCGILSLRSETGTVQLYRMSSCLAHRCSIHPVNIGCISKCSIDCWLLSLTD